MTIRDYIDKNLEAILNDLSDLVSFKSVLSDDEKPFGSENRKALDYMLNKMKDSGFNTKNLDYYAGYGEIGSGEKLIGLLAHLDVVPVSDGWLSDPFKMDIRNNYCYGRGVSDDKGAAIASYHALKYLKEINYPLNKRVRLVLGCNEENGSKCLEYYVAKEGHIDYGFTPDGNFPGIYAEKGMYQAIINFKGTKILAIKGGEARNIVCPKVSISFSDLAFDLTLFKKYLDDNSLKYEINDKEITVYGTAAHASLPHLGKNAIAYLMKALEIAGFDDDFVRFFNKYFGLDYNGKGLNIALVDDYGDLTLNIGLIEQKDNIISFSIDIRFPISFKYDVIVTAFEKLNSDNVRVDLKHTENPLFFDPNSPMLKALHSAYQKVTNDYESKMEVIGGGTYAKGINNCIAFGCAFKDEDNHIHDSNEELSIESLKKQIEIYVEAIMNLNKL